MIWIIPLVLIVVGIISVVSLLIRKMPQLRVINVDSIPKERTRKIKEQIILQKFQRASGDKMKGVTSLALMIGRTFSRTGRRIVQRLYTLEQYYQKLKRSASEGQHAYDAETIHRLIEEAETLRQKDELIPAEKMYIDIISHNPKSVDAYEGLGNLYLANNQFDQARETLQFSLRLSPNDASVLVSLAQLEMKLDQPKSSLVHLKKAIQKRPKNPKYLDLYIEVSLKAGSLKDAQEGIKRLKEVNPENQKIQDFETRFSEQKASYITKSHSSTDDASQTE
ncbi:MAG: tetratricopeptide repeat protein [Candidatus Uhrbacteria bacterium]|nr:tetratricopeptide repeat protein [Candidatus Uhrbacteria bacterium]